MLFEDFDLRTLLVDLRSVKMTQEDRRRVDALRAQLKLTATQVGVAWALVRRFHKQLEELHAARERARKSRGRARLGLSREDVDAAVAARSKAEEEARKNLGL